MSSPEHFRIDCLIEPFTARTINGLQFLPAFDNPLRPMTPTGLHHVGPLHDQQLALYEGLHEHFPITRLGVDEVSAYEAHEKLKKDRAAAYLPKKAAPVPKLATSLEPTKSDAATDQSPGQDPDAGAGDPDGPSGADAAPKAKAAKASAKEAKSAATPPSRQRSRRRPRPRRACARRTSRTRSSPSTASLSALRCARWATRPRRSST